MTAHQAKIEYMSMGSSMEMSSSTSKEKHWEVMRFMAVLFLKARNRMNSGANMMRVKPTEEIYQR